MAESPFMSDEVVLCFLADILDFTIDRSVSITFVSWKIYDIFFNESQNQIQIFDTPLLYIYSKLHANQHDAIPPMNIPLP